MFKSDVIPNQVPNIIIFFQRIYQQALTKAELKIIAAILAIVLIGLPTVDDYGLSVDEPTEIAMLRRNFELVTEDKRIPGDLRFFGTFFNLTAETVFQIKQYLTNAGDYHPLNYQTQAEDEQAKIAALAARVEVKHYVTFCFSLITYAAVACLVGILTGWNYAWFGAISLAFLPQFWGHSFFNPKDPPFAAIFTLTTLAGAYLVNYYLQTDKKIKPGLNRTTLYTVLFGILVGILSGIRIGGFLVLGFILITYLFLAFSQKVTRKQYLNFAGLYLIICLSWFASNTIWYPAFWHNPVSGFLETINYLSGHLLKIKVLFAGKEIFIQNVPRNYLITWMWMTVPLIFQIGFFLGIGLIIAKYKQLTNLQKATAILVFCQVVCLPLIAIIKNSPIYDGMRHFLFTLPGIAVFTATAAIWIYRLLPQKNLKIIAVTFIVIVYSAIARDAIALHPYQYIYFNRISGGLPAAHGRYDTEYWGLSLREGIEWINQQNPPKNTTVLVNGFLYSAQIYAAPNLNLINYQKTQPTTLPKPFYYLAWSRWNAPEELPECPTIHQVTRQQTPLTTIKYCQ
ncbi:MAG: hypothetical protein SAJ37_05645 [Oscillatoria sp. PMC 1068.18]|nr:hypothetical protein [Oscillatoria sp. PMC 1076.18]MEC4988214.1 hypothetical protein [Oscillatoria sp. PMC 1068.18]